MEEHKIVAGGGLLRPPNLPLFGNNEWVALGFHEGDRMVIDTGESAVYLDPLVRAGEASGILSVVELTSNDWPMPLDTSQYGILPMLARSLKDEKESINDIWWLIRGAAELSASAHWISDRPGRIARWRNWLEAHGKLALRGVQRLRVGYYASLLDVVASDVPDYILDAMADTELSDAAKLLVWKHRAEVLPELILKAFEQMPKAGKIFMSDLNRPGIGFEGSTSAFLKYIMAERFDRMEPERSESLLAMVETQNPLPELLYLLAWSIGLDSLTSIMEETAERRRFQSWHNLAFEQARHLILPTDQERLV